MTFIKTVVDVDYYSTDKLAIHGNNTETCCQTLKNTSLAETQLKGS